MTDSEQRRPTDQLTYRQWQVIEMLTAGLTTEDIEHRLGISHHAYVHHRRGILAAYDAPTMLVAAVLHERSKGH